MTEIKVLGGTTKYRVPPPKAYRKLGLGIVADGRIKVVAGFRVAWWDTEGRVVPLVVNARILRLKAIP